MKTEFVKPFLSQSIRICKKCGKVDINTYARYKLNGDKYTLVGAYSKCQNCEHVKEFTKDELKRELRK